MTPYYSDPWLTVYQGDCREVLASMEAESVQCVVTSPPYWGLRDYGTATWIGGDEACDHRPAAPSRAQRPAGGLEGGKATVDAGTVMRGDCGRCGAQRRDSQLGLEPTPEEYVANMVDVFREVRRVLRADGTVWLNLGDSYASHDPGGYRQGEHLNPGGRQAAKGSGRNRAGTYRPVGLKPKDLVGIPWRVAFALQQPYYTGTIRDERDRIWLAAMLDAEGCMFLHKRKVGQSNGQGYVRKNDTYGAGMEIANTSLAIVERCMAIAGGRGSISRQDKDRRQPLYRWSMRSNECRDVVRELYPHLVAKQHQARLLLGCPSSGQDAEKAHAGLIELHGGGVPTIDFPAPASMFEPGWYVRSDVIWSKLNPMPESVTDRPTKSHEYLFLLSKSARYFFDADAVRETYQRDYDARTWDERKALGQTSGNREPDRMTLTSHIGHDLGGGGAGRNLRSVWTVATQPYPGAHFATFPEKLIEPCIKAGSPAAGKRCDCDAPILTPLGEGAADDPTMLTGRAGMNRPRRPDEGVRPITRREQRDYAGQLRESSHRAEMATEAGDAFAHYIRTDASGARPAPPRLLDEWRTRGWLVDPQPCLHPAEGPGVVLDPFAGSGTTGRVAQRLSRRAVLIDLNADYLVQAMGRNSEIPLGLEAS